jgi:hypothetical protein
MKLIEKVRYQISIKSVFELLKIKEGMLGYYCPYCNEQTGAVMLKETENRFKCTACKKEGISVDIVKKIQNITTEDAVQFLAEKFDIDDDSEFEDNLLASWKSEAQHNKPSVNDFFGIEEEDNLTEDIELYKEIYKHSTEDETTMQYLELKGFSKDLIEKLAIKTLNKPHLFYEKFAKKYSKTNINKAGLLNKDREFIFQKHKVIIPFFDNENTIKYIAGWNIGDRKFEFITPLNKSVPVYFPNIFDNSENLFITDDFRGVFAFLKKGFNALTAFGNLDTDSLKIAKDKKVSICSEKNEKGNKFSRQIIKQLTEAEIDFVIGNFSPAFEDYGEYLTEKKK